MGTKYNIVFGVDVSDKSLVDAKSKIEYVLMKSGITIAQYNIGTFRLLYSNYK